ncbi:leucyl/phenylalanyl-tRNA--protein transferase [Motiliproteus sp. MSK22-1]|uniref:leucyl/phenylalanyl-tRNA--protein transferase n=1 Tax=Motiliproteus sp. MSK22-1 TaxID=1897630 RepID=UPI000977A2B5|nr:leucyl/phenylalanyl-tRNA--protein transferase [Motiliproteus sp. MSK22-1]OMH32723.1 leucyl/phenylalanyl-tRNA--protein transferase [Motiliproteus sp. MSK22-1]
MSSIYWLEPDSIDFPPADLALRDPNGLLAAGGDLSLPRLVSAYQNGIFPWFDDDQPILWWSPDPRCVLFPDQLYLSKSLRKALRKQDYSVTFDRAFETVITSCSAPRASTSETWITEDMKQAYAELHHAGFAHSVEVWRNGELVGGLYGIAMGRMFFGESMFSKQRDASKIAFVYLVEQLRTWGYYLIDCQVHSDHLASLGAGEIPRSEFLKILNREINTDVQHTWHMNWCYQKRESS